MKKIQLYFLNKKTQGFLRYFNNTSWLFGEKILRMIVGLVVGAWVARHLGPERFGLFSYAQSFVALFSIIATLGLNSVVVKELVDNKKNGNVLIGTSYFMMLLASIFVILLLFFATFFTSNDGYTNILIFVISSATVFQSFNVIDFYFQSKVLSKYIVFANLASLFVSSILKICFIFMDYGVLSFAILVVFDSFVLSLGFIFFYKTNQQELRKWKYEHKTAGYLLKKSAPLIFAGVVNSVYMRIDQVMIKEMLNSVQVGYYSAAIRLSEAWFAFGVIVCNSLFPALVNARKVSSELYLKRLHRLFLFLVSSAYVLSIIIWFLSEFIIVALYSKVFLLSSSVLSIHIFSSVFVYLGVASGRWLIIENKNLLNLYRNIFGLVINVLLNFFLIPDYGVLGAAYASLVAYVCAFYLMDIFQKETREIFFLKTKSLFLLR